MPNVTIHLDEETHRLAKVYAATSGSSLSEMFRQHVRRLAGRAVAEVSEAIILARYAAFEIPAKDAMDALGIDCLEALMIKTINAGLHLPHDDQKTALAMAQKFLDDVSP